MEQIRILILGKNEIVREGLKAILTDQGFVVEAAVPDCAHIPADLRTGTAPDVIIVDSTSNADGLDTCNRLHPMFPSSRLVLMAEDQSIDTIALAFDAGVHGYLAKEMSGEPLVNALKLVAAGEKMLPSKTIQSLVQELIDRHPPTPRVDWEATRADMSLSDREVEVLRCLICGEANKLISRRLLITETTVKVHIKAILRKVGALNRTQAAIWAVNQGLNERQPSNEPTHERGWRAGGDDNGCLN